MELPIYEISASNFLYEPSLDITKPILDNFEHLKFLRYICLSCLFIQTFKY